MLLENFESSKNSSNVLHEYWLSMSLSLPDNKSFSRIKYIGVIDTFA